MKEKRVKIFKITMLVLFILIMIILTIRLAPIFKNISTEAGRIEFKNEIESLGVQGVLIILGLMLVQIFIPILPGEPVEILAGMSFGPIGGLILVLVGSLISSLIIFFAVRKFGRGFIYSFVPKEKIDKIENSKVFKDQKKIYTILFILFFIPGTPKDIIIYISGLLPIKPTKFLLIATLARIPSVISSTIAGSSLIEGNWLVIALAYGVTFIIAGVIVVVLKRKKQYIKL